MPIDHTRFYPFYGKCVELDIPICVTAGVPGPRVPFAAQHVERIDQVCYDFPELRFVTRHGCEPWTELAVELLLKWPNLFYSTSGFAPRHYPKPILDYANTRGVDKVMYAGYYPTGLSLDRIVSELRRAAPPRRCLGELLAVQRHAGVQTRPVTVRGSLGRRHRGVCSLRRAVVAVQECSSSCGADPMRVNVNSPTLLGDVNGTRVLGRHDTAAANSGATMDATTSIDFSDAELFALEVPHQLFDRIRAEQPVYWSQTNADDGFWVLTRHADVETVNRDTASFTSSQGIGVPRLTIEQTAALADNLMFVDPPRHTKMRKLIGAAFTPRRIARLEALIGQYCAEIVASIHDKAEFDFVHEVAAQLPVRVIADIMGMPESDRGLILQWALGTYGRQDNDDGEAEFMESFRAIFRYVAELREHRLESPGDDVFTELTQADVDGERLTDGEFANFFFLLSQAGFETTHTLIAQGQQLMFEHPDQERVLRDDPMLIGSAVEEMLRHVTPITHQARTATATSWSAATRSARVSTSRCGFAQRTVIRRSSVTPTDSTSLDSRTLTWHSAAAGLTTASART